MEETTKTPATVVTYNAMNRKVTIRFRDQGIAVLQLQDALRLGQQLVNLLQRAQCDEAV